MLIPIEQKVTAHFDFWKKHHGINWKHLKIVFDRKRLTKETEKIGLKDRQVLGLYVPHTKTIFMSRNNYKTEEWFSRAAIVLLHELQHVIQHYDSRLSVPIELALQNADYAALKLYEIELEAYNASARIYRAHYEELYGPPDPKFLVTPSMDSFRKRVDAIVNGVKKKESKETPVENTTTPQPDKIAA